MANKMTIQQNGFDSTVKCPCCKSDITLTLPTVLTIKATAYSLDCPNCNLSVTGHRSLSSLLKAWEDLVKTKSNFRNSYGGLRHAG